MIDCPAEGMWTDILTKTLQGMFKTMRAELMNYPVNCKDPVEPQAKKSTRQCITGKRTVTRKSAITTLGITGLAAEMGNGQMSRTSQKPMRNSWKTIKSEKKAVEDERGGALTFNQSFCNTMSCA